MSSMTILINTNKANLYHFGLNGVEKQEIAYAGKKHPIETFATNHPIHQTDEEKFYHQVCAVLEKTSANEWLILGAGQGVDHFLNHLEKHHPVLKKNIVGQFKIPHLTENQLLATARGYFRKIHTFQTLLTF
ncbi:hypothetical protein [Pseudobdellovibrio sp. HCB154]|uniref:hypothetical protein n=1 Tax=Pseudobdellovibrio sp. HCB154 TaxID=3386277 RepID=UPI003916DB6E